MKPYIGKSRQTHRLQLIYSYFFPAKAMLIILIPLLLLFQVLIYALHREEMHIISEQILARTAMLVEQYSQTLSALEAQDNVRCSPDDVIEMLALIRESSLIADIGRVHDGQLQCTAMLGVIADSKIPLPQADYSVNGYHFVPAQQGFDGVFNQHELVYKDHTAVFLTPEPFEDIRLSPHYVAVVQSVKSNHTFLQLGKPRSSWMTSVPGFTRLMSYQQCPDKNTVCVTVMDQQPLIFSTFNAKELITVGGILVLVFMVMRMLTVESRDSKLMALRLRKAIIRRALSVEYQPKIDIQTGQMTGAETLCRWYDPLLGSVSPVVFIPLAEQLNLMKGLTKGVIDAALSEMGPILKQQPDFVLSINLALGDYLDQTFISNIAGQVQAQGIRAAQLMFEITEHSRSDFKNAEKISKLVKSYGFKVSIDDFGTGYSNLSWLSDLSADEVKIDRMFTTAIGTDTIEGKTLEMMLDLLKKFDSLSVVLEGIETSEEATLFKALNRTYVGQGWYYAKSMPIETLVAYVNQTQVEK